MNEFIFYTLVPAMFFAILILGALSMLSVILEAVFEDKPAGDVFDSMFFIFFIAMCSAGILLMLIMGISGIIMLVNF